jgi:hypothetical protein
MELVGGLMNLIHMTGSGVAINDGSKLSSAEGGFPVRRPIPDYIIPLNVTTSKSASTDLPDSSRFATLSSPS